MKVNCSKCVNFDFYSSSKEKGFCLDKEANPTFKDDSIHPFKIYYKQLSSCNNFKEKK